MLTRVDFTPLMAPFHDRQDGPEWFIRAFPLAREEDKKNYLILWRRYLTPQFLSIVIVGVNLGLVAYQPNLVARQFGLCQLVPKSLFNSHELLVDIIIDQPFEMIKDDIGNLWARRPTLTLTPFQPSFYCTKEFETWWQSYFVTFIGDSNAKLAELTTTFSNL